MVCKPGGGNKIQYVKNQKYALVKDMLFLYDSLGLSALRFPEIGKNYNKKYTKVFFLITILKNVTCKSYIN